MSDLTTLAELAEKIGVNKSTVSRHVAKLAVGTKIGTLIALTSAEARQVSTSISEARPGNPNAATARTGKTAKNRSKSPKKKKSK